MFRRGPHRYAAFAVALIITSVVALLPPSWLRPWTNDLERLVTFPLAPFGHAGNSLAGWLRPAPDPYSDLSPAARDRLNQAEAEKERFARLYRERERRIIELEADIAELESIPLRQMPAETTPLRANVTRRTPDKLHGVVHLNRGESAGVETNTVAVYSGTHLVGRITEVSRLQSALLPLTNTSTPAINALVYPRDRPDISPREAPVIQLIPNGDGTFSADADRVDQLATGDFVYLYDHTWPDTAQHLMVGTIDTVRPKDDAPLRDAVVVRPRFMVPDVANVTLLIERQTNSVAMEDGA
ncbi:MAG: rod shape-determining protein MreC [Planctomycetota bacterium]